MKGKVKKNQLIIVALAVMIAAAVLIANILTDVAYGILDPRISYK